MIDKTTEKPILKKLMKIISALLIVVVLLGAPMLAKFITNLFDLSAIDPDGAFLWLTIRHTLQALLVAVVIIIIKAIKPVSFNLGLGDKQIGLKYTKRFMAFFFIYTAVTFLVVILSGGFQPFQFPLVARNIFGYLGFQLFLSGPSEEFIFRAFAITMFGLLVTNKRIGKHLSYANLFAALVFGLAHVGFSFSPFEITYSLPQIFLSIGLGYFYGDCYEKSRSVIYPMIMHSFTNVLMVGTTIIITALS